MAKTTELHIIQNFAPSCLNRDDTNSPKDCEFGGYRRARISSQCLKRSIRLHPVFGECLEEKIGVRTKLLIGRLTWELTQNGKPERECCGAVPLFVSALMSAVDGQKTKVLLYLGDDEIARLAELAQKNWSALVDAAAASVPEGEGVRPRGRRKAPSAIKELVKDLKRSWVPGTRAADIALFGRMMAEHPDLNIDAACQVAHAISTHRVSMEMDFFTAVDDLKPREESGAGMLGISRFNSSCFYRYSLVDLQQLKENLGGDDELCLKTVEAFLRASVAAIPTGKQNGTAAHNPPDTIFAVVRKSGAPLSLANAFEKPVRPGRELGLVEASTLSMAEYWGKMTGIYGEEGVIARPVLSVCNGLPGPFGEKRVSSFEEMTKTVLDAVGTLLHGGDGCRLTRS